MPNKYFLNLLLIAILLCCWQQTPFADTLYVSKDTLIIDKDTLLLTDTLSPYGKKIQYPPPFLYKAFHALLTNKNTDTTWKTWQSKNYATIQKYYPISPTPYLYQITQAYPTIYLPPLDSLIKNDSTNTLSQTTITNLNPPLNNTTNNTQKNNSAIPKPIETVYYPDTLPYSAMNSNLLPLDIQKLRNTTNNTYLFYIFLFIFLLYAICNQLSKNFFTSLYASFSNIKLAGQQFEEYYIKTRLLFWSFIMNIIVGITFGLSIFIALLHQTQLSIPIIHHQPLLSVIIIILITVLFILIRHFLLQMLSNLLNVGKTLPFYTYNSILINLFMGVIIMPITLLTAFAQKNIATLSMQALIITFIFLILYQIYRGILISKDIIRVHKFHFFLYLCAFEISPYLILFKIIQTTWLKA